MIRKNSFNNLKKFTVVSDPGVDDIIALLLLKKLSNKISHALISSYGNVSEDLTSKNAKEFIALIAKNWKFRHGSKNPLKPLECPWADYYHGPDGVWNIHSEAKINNIRSIKQFPQNNSIISLGPLTDVYKIFLECKISDITIMGGAFKETGNETKYAETNI
jgi:inosine-uridine nucleoside N-ribohydrolase